MTISFVRVLSTASVALFVAIRVKCSLLLYDDQLHDGLVYSKCSVPCCCMTISFVRVLSTVSIAFFVAVCVQCSLLLHDDQLHEGLVNSKCSVLCCSTSTPQSISSAV